jgi:hypothetical protein
MIRGMLRLFLENVRWFSAVLYVVDAVALLSLAAASLQVSMLLARREARLGAEPPLRFGERVQGVRCIQDPQQPKSIKLSRASRRA